MGYAEFYKQKLSEATSRLKPVHLSEKYIPFLPATAVINDKGLIRDYLSSVSAFTLLTLIGKNDKFINSNSINGLIEDIDNTSKEIYRNIGKIAQLQFPLPPLPHISTELAFSALLCFKLFTCGIFIINITTTINRYI